MVPSRKAGGCKSGDSSVELGVEKRKQPEAGATQAKRQGKRRRGGVNTWKVGEVVRGTALEHGKEHQEAAESRGVKGDGPVVGGVRTACGRRGYERLMVVAGKLPGHVRRTGWCGVAVKEGKRGDTKHAPYDG